MTLRLSIKNMIKPLLRLFIVVTVIVTIGFLYAGGYDANLLPGFIIILCIPVLPTTYLFIEYYIATRNQVVEITNDSISVKKKNGSTVHYSFSELKILKLYKSAGMEKGSFPYQTAEMFYHAKIKTKDDRVLILTSFLGPKFDDALDLIKNVDKEITRTTYSTIYI